MVYMYISQQRYISVYEGGDTIPLAVGTSARRVAIPCGASSGRGAADSARADSARAAARAAVLVLAL